MAEPESSEVRRMRIERIAIAAALLLVAGCAVLGGGYRSEIDAWHAERIADLSSPKGWLTLVGLYPLEPGVSTLGSSPYSKLLLPRTAPEQFGSIAVSDSIVMVIPATAVVAYIGDEAHRIYGWEALRSDRDGSPTVVTAGSIELRVIDRGGALYLRVKDSASTVLRDFAGVNRWPVDRRWRVRARLVAGGPDFTVAVPNVLGQVSDSPSPGWLEFELMGETHRLLPVGEAGEPLFIIFGDETNGAGSYGAGRFLETGSPAPDGSVEIDFNRAYNPPCAFTPYATCPLPPQGNQLPVAVTAGEMNWGERH